VRTGRSDTLSLIIQLPNTRKMPEIILNEKQKAYCKKAEAEGKKSFISHDLLFNFINDKWVVTNAHTGKEFKVLNK